MSLRTAAANALLAGAACLAVASAAPAYALCESYSGGCPSPPAGTGNGGTDVGGGTDQPGTGGTDQPGTGSDNGTGGGSGSGGASGGPSTLPFTGGELVLMTAIGAGALAGGTALVVAGRRRGQVAA